MKRQSFTNTERNDMSKEEKIKQLLGDILDEIAIHTDKMFRFGETEVYREDNIVNILKTITFLKQKS